MRSQPCDIHATYDDRLLHDELIPCNCTKCTTSKTPHEYTLKALERRLNVGKKFTVSCDESFEDVNIRNLISDFPDLTRTDRYEFDREPKSGIRHPTPVEYTQQPITLNVNVEAKSMTSESKYTNDLKNANIANFANEVKDNARQ